MLMPKRSKFRKCQKGRLTGTAYRGSEVSFGEFGLKAVTNGWVTSRQIEAARIAITRYMKRSGKVWIRVFPHKPVTKHPAETRMGSGKGTPEMHVVVVKPGMILFEVEGIPRDQAEEAMRLAGHKLPVRTRTVARDEIRIE